MLHLHCVTPLVSSELCIREFTQNWLVTRACLCIYFCRPARNPYDRNKIAGGSSSGSAAVVSAGLCPVALGVDGGGILFMCA